MGPDLWELFEDGQADDEVAAIIRLGHFGTVPANVRMVTQFGEIITVRMRRGDIPKVSGAAEVAEMIAGDSYLGPDVELDVAAPELANSMLDTDERRPATLKATGKGVVIGVVDWGFDFAHPDFRNADGTTRIVALWDQRGGKRQGSPAPFGYGILHDRDAINHALKQSDPYAALQYHPADADTGIGCHGTHVTSIAAGTGGNGRPVGLAPQAELILVHNSPWSEEQSGKLGDSVTVLEGIDFIARRATDRPWVVNLSMGRHAECHDGTTLLEQGFDAALQAAPGRCICNSVGNYFERQIHAAGQLRPSQERTLNWIVNEGQAPSDYNELEIWYSGQDKFEVGLRSPDGSITARVKVGERAKLVYGGKEVGNAYHRAQEPNNLANHVDVFLYKEAPKGTWEVTVFGSDVIDGRFNAWIEREVVCPKCQSHFTKEDADPNSTTGSICNGRRTIAVGAYSTHDPERRLAHFSSKGPTADGRLKPDLCAPGVNVLAARSAGRDPHKPVPPVTRMSGTSMANPHVVGCVALMFGAASRRLRIEETHNLLLANAERVKVPEEYPDRIGIGFLDVEAAVEAAQKVGAAQTFKEVTVQPPAQQPKASPMAEAAEFEFAETPAFEGRADAFENEPTSSTNSFHRVANEITSSFEGGQTSTLNLYDLGIISYGKHQATLASGTLYPILKRYTELSNSQTATAIAAFLDRVRQRDPTLRDDQSFIRLLKDAAHEPAMAQAQDEGFTKLYWEPATKRAATANISSALGYVLLYDTNVQGGLDAVLKATRQRLGGSIGDTAGGRTISELEFLQAFVDERMQRHLRIAGHQRKLAAELTNEANALELAALTSDPALAPELLRQAAEKRVRAKQNLANASALETSATKTRGPSFKSLVESGDLNLYGDANGDIHLAGKPGVTIRGLKPGAGAEALAPSEVASVAFEMETGDAESVRRKHSAATNGESTQAESVRIERPFPVGPDVAELTSEAAAVESIAAEELPDGLTCVGDCPFPSDRDLKLIRPKGKAEGDFTDRTEGDRKINLWLQLTDYDVNAYIADKLQHVEAFKKIRDFIVDRSVQTNEPIAVTITGLASRTGGRQYNDVLSCKRALCAGARLKLMLDEYRGVLSRVQINTAGAGFMRSSCNGSDCEVGEWRSVLIQVHAPNNPPAPIPPIDPGWDKYTIRCCSYQTKTLVTAVLTDLLNKGLPEVPDAIKGKLLGFIKKGLEKLVKILGKRFEKVAELTSAVGELLELFPGEIYNATGVFEIREREKTDPRNVVLCYSGWGLRITFPRDNIDDLIDDAMNKEKILKLLPPAIKKQLRDEIKKLIPDSLKSLLAPIEATTPGPAASFDLLHPRNIGVFGGDAQVSGDLVDPGRVFVGFDSARWHAPDPWARPHIARCDTSCDDSVISMVVGDGRGLELLAVSHGTLAAGPCVCSSTPSPSAATQSEWLAKPAEVFDAFASRNISELRQQLDQEVEVLALPKSRLDRELQEGDILVRRGDAGSGHVSVIASSGLKSLDALRSEGWRPEVASNGNFAQVIESGLTPHAREDNYARKVTESSGFVPKDTLVLRPKKALGEIEGGKAPTETLVADSSEGDAERVNGLDLLLATALLSRSQPAPVIVTTAPSTKSDGDS